MSPARRLGPPELVLLAFAGASVLALVVLTRVWLPTMVRMYADFGGRLPGLTRAVIAGAWLPASALAVVVPAGAGLLAGRRPWRLGLLVAAVALGVVLCAGTVLAAYLPIFHLADAVRAD